MRGLSNREVMDPEGPPILLAVRFELDCPISQKDDAKALGARWDPTNKKIVAGTKRPRVHENARVEEKNRLQLKGEGD